MDNGSTTAIFFSAVAILAALLWVKARRRTAAIKELATKNGFHFLGEALPKSLSLSGTPFESAKSIWNTVDGERYGIRVIAFDCQMGEGKASWRRTVVAAQTSVDLFGCSYSTKSLTSDRSGEWILLYQPRGNSIFASGLMSVEELENHINGIQT